MMKIKSLIVLLIVQFLLVSCIDEGDVKLDRDNYQTANDTVPDTETMDDKFSKDFKVLVDLPEQIETVEKRLDKSETLNVVYAVIILLLIVAIVLVYFHDIQYFYKNSKKLWKKYDDLDKRLSDYYNRINSQSASITSIDEKCKKAATAQSFHHSHNDEKKDNEKGDTKQVAASSQNNYHIETSPQSLGTISGGKSIYGKSYDDCSIKEDNGNKAQYEIFQIKDNMGNFRFVGTLNYIQNNPRVISNICEYEGNIDMAKNYLVTKDGKCRLKTNGIWEIVEKSKMKFE